MKTCSTIADLEAVPCFEPFRGGNGIALVDREWWELFELDGGGPDDDVWDEADARGLEVLNLEPERCDDFDTDPRTFSDLHAALQYLARGGTLVKLPDTMEPDCKHWRLFVCTNGDAS